MSDFFDYSPVNKTRDILINCSKHTLVSAADFFAGSYKRLEQSLSNSKFLHTFSLVIQCVDLSEFLKSG